MATTAAMSPDVLITIKLQVGAENRRFKLPLRELGANTLPDKLRHLLAVPPTKNVVFERYSDSAAAYVTLDNNNPSVYKQLYRAAKAKLKLRIKATISDATIVAEAPEPEPTTPDRLPPHRYVPPMNPDPLKISSIIAPNTMPHETSANVNLPSPTSWGRATEHVQRQAYARFVQDNMSSFVKSIDNEDVVTSTPNAAEDLKNETKLENPVAVKQEVDVEAPVPHGFSDTTQHFAGLTSTSKNQSCILKSFQATTHPGFDHSFHVPGTSFTVCCNKCDSTIPDAHWHCSICDDGDYDLCRDCVNSGVHCGAEDHFLIKRYIENGKVVSSTTETMAPKRVTKIEAEKEVPGAFTSEPKEEQLPETLEMSRTCNSCVNVFEESNFVTCAVCEDYDLCIPCHVGLKHGHHPNHAFKPVSEVSTLDVMATLLLAPGRNMLHFAVCDGCDKDIYGVRHKCMNCPDWDFCSTCIKSARHIHPGHRFLPIYEIIPNPPVRSQVHYGVHCDGPLCKGKPNQFYIVGDRYKCAVCHDTDFCASCEALPTHRHNRTHPLIKFRTPVRNVSVTTLGEKENGEAMYAMGDKTPSTSSKSTETIPSAPSANAATQVQTVAEVKPIEVAKEEVKEEQSKPTTELQAAFLRDAVADGSRLQAGHLFEQVWTLRNPGPYAWPAGCSVRYVGGDNMLNVDRDHPSSISDVANATESNVTDRIVEVGEKADFAVTMKAPQRAGKAISYWRLKSADGTPFGHKLWCDIDVIIQEPGIEIEHIEDAGKEIKKDVSPTDEHKEFQEAKTKSQSESQMIFPKLDKESPVSSTHDIAPVAAPATTPTPATLPTAERDILEDVENLELDDEDDTDDGFLTDEEYEILDANDSDVQAINGKK